MEPSIRTTLRVHLVITPAISPQPFFLRQRTHRESGDFRKRLIEGLRRSQWMSGHEWWCFAEFWMGESAYKLLTFSLHFISEKTCPLNLAANGIVDYAFDLKPGVTTAAVRSFVGDMVLLVEDPGLPAAYLSGDSLNATLLLSNYGPSSVSTNSIKWSVVAGGVTICSGSGDKAGTVGQGEVGSVGAVNCKLPDLGTFPASTGKSSANPQLVELQAHLQASDGRFVNNSWQMRVYPMFLDTKAPRPYYVAQGTAPSPNLLQQCMFNDAKMLPAGGAVEASAVILTTDLSDDVLSALAHNATVLLVVASQPARLIPTVTNSFESCWWLGSPSDNNVGTVVYDDADGMLTGMSEGWCDGTWERMIDGSKSFVMEHVNTSVHTRLGSALTYSSNLDWNPVNAQIHIRALDYVLGGPRSKALLFELGGGGGSSGGRLIATGLNLLQTFNASVKGGFEHPEKAYLLWKLLENGMTGGSSRTRRLQTRSHTTAPDNALATPDELKQQNCSALAGYVVSVAASATPQECWAASELVDVLQQLACPAGSAASCHGPLLVKGELKRGTLQIAVGHSAAMGAGLPAAELAALPSNESYIVRTLPGSHAGMASSVAVSGRQGATRGTFYGAG